MLHNNDSPTRFQAARISMIVLRKLSLLLLLLFTANIARGQVELIKDMNLFHDPLDREYKEAIDRNGVLFFISNNELWKTNSTTSGTFKVKSFIQIHSLRNVNGTLYFAANDGTGLELWKSTSTTGGTTIVKDVVPGVSGCDPRQLTVVNGLLFFNATTPANGKELWKSDGTAAGTTLVREIMVRAGSSNPANLTSSNGVLMFTANDGVHGYELWRSDGTADGTSIVRDIRTGSRLSSAPQHVTDVNGAVFFSADDGVHGRELWKSDGTASGTVLVRDVIVGSGGTYYANFTNVNGVLFFSANNITNGEELWKSDGTPGGTMMVADLTPGKRGSGYQGTFSPPMTNFTAINGKLYFTAHKSGVYFFWKSDGTESGTIPFLAAGNIGMSPLKASFTLLDGNLYFINGMDRSGDNIAFSIMREDASGKLSRVTTQLLNDYYESESPLLVQSRNLIYFTGRRSVEEGHSLFKSIGTPSGTHWVADTFIARNQPSNPTNFLKVKDAIYFTTTTGYYGEGRHSLWRTDGTETGTIKLIVMDEIHSLVELNGEVFFSGTIYGTATSALKRDIYRSNGTPEGTRGLGFTHLETHPSYMSASYLTVAGNRIYYVAGYKELWITDGTSTSYVFTSPYLNRLHAVGDLLYFGGPDSDGKIELFRTNGTTAGTRLVKDINPNGHSDVRNMTSHKGILYFVADDGVHGNQVWRSNGTSAGTYMVKATADPVNPHWLETISNLIPSDNGVYFLSRNESATWQLWISNGTSAGTVELADINEPLRYSLLAVGGRAYFLAADYSNPASPYQLWKSDGTQATTGLIKPLESFYYSSVDKANTTVVNGIFYFSFAAENLWRSDGTACGTYVLNDVNQSPYPLASLGNEIIFGYNNVAIGRELFKANVSSFPAVNCVTGANAFASVEVPDETGGVHIHQYPNPFDEEFVLDVSGEEGGKFHVNILDMKGVSFEQQHGLSYNQPHPLGARWSPGMYILQVREANGVTVRKVVKR